MQTKFFSKWISRGIAYFLALVPFVASAESGNSDGDTFLTGGATSGLPAGSILEIVSNTMDWILAIFGFIAIIGFVISGILYLTAAGNDKQATSAKNAMTFSIIGVIVALLGYVIVLAVSNWLSGSSSF